MSVRTPEARDDSSIGAAEGAQRTAVPASVAGVPGRAQTEATVGYVGSAAFAQRILHVAEQIPNSSLRLVSAISEKAGNAREMALKIADDVDVVLFSGPLAYDTMIAEGGLPVPSVFVPLGGPALPIALLSGMREMDVDIERVSIDSVSPAEVSETYEEFGTDPTAVQVMEYEATATPHDFHRFHVESFRSGGSSAAVTTLPSVADTLRHDGVPVLTMRPTTSTLRNSLNTAMLVGGGASLENERAAIIVVRVPATHAPRRSGQTNSTFVELRLTLMQELLHEAREMDALVLPRDDTSFLIVVSMGSLRAATQGLASVPFADRIKAALGFEPDVGIGVGRTAVEAELRAEEAADGGAAKSPRETLLHGPHGAVVHIPRGDERIGSVIAASSGEKKEAEILRQIIHALVERGRADRIVEAEEVAELLDVTLRTARRYLRQLVQADLAWQLPPSQTNKVGRPPIPYRLLDQRLRG